MVFTMEFLSIFSVNVTVCLPLLVLLWCSSYMNFVLSQSGGSNGTDHLALLAIKAHIINDPFHVLSSWNDSTPYCEWSGVLCGGRLHPNRVRALRLPSNGLVGSLAPEIGNLSFLREITLYNNSFHGEIPREVSFLSQLRSLSLSNNSFEGKIPSNISRCSNLMILRLGSNNLVGEIPVELGSLSKLQYLSFHMNGLTGQIPSSFGNLSSLDTISGAYNELSGSISDALGQLTRLMYFGFGSNKLSGTLPPNMYNISSLIYFDVGINQLQGSLPSDLGFNLPNLVRLVIAGNQFHGPIPVSVTNLSNLELLLTGGNSFSGKVTIDFGGLSRLVMLSFASNNLGSKEAIDLDFVNTLTNCTSLTLLELSYNQFGGLLPNSIGNLSSQLTNLDFSYNQISGDITVGMRNLVSLQNLDLSYNLLEGSIPFSIGTHKMLKKLHLEGNRLTGAIPSSLGNLTQLIELDLGDNQLQGNISHLGSCKYLLRLGLSSNGFNGSIPSEIFDLSMLISLNLSRNSLVGSLPLEVGGLTSLGILDLSKNMLFGEIPTTLGDCVSLEHVFLRDNLFQGSIPSSLSSLKGLEGLDLSHNNLSGVIPKYLGTFKFLQNLNLSFNHFEGEVPAVGVFENFSAISIIGNDKLCGGIPELQLSACHTQKLEQDGKHHVSKMVAIICSCVGFLCLIFIIIFIVSRKRKGKEESTPSLIELNQFKVSYAQLLKATDGFSSSNLIGIGSFGSVYKGVLREVVNYGDIVAAIKVLNISQSGASKSFVVECESLRNIRHRNLVKILTSCSSIDFEGNDFKALVYEFMPKGNLESWLHPHASDIQDEPRHLNLVQRLHIAIDVATALDYLHHHCHMQIVHCDLKPSNILLDDDLTAHLGDFGISRILSKVTGRPQNNTSSIGIKGSIGYIAPEYGAGVDASTHGDVYSFGILLLEMFTGKRPTHEMFKDNFNIHRWAEMALQDGVMSSIEPSLLSMEANDEEAIKIIPNNTGTGSRRSMKDKVHECLNLIITVGVSSSRESPLDRMDIKDVVKELHLIKNIYLKCNNLGM